MSKYLPVVCAVNTWTSKCCMRAKAKVPHPPLKATPLCHSWLRSCAVQPGSARHQPAARAFRNRVPTVQRLSFCRNVPCWLQCSPSQSSSGAETATGPPATPWPAGRLRKRCTDAMERSSPHPFGSGKRCYLLGYPDASFVAHFACHARLWAFCFRRQPNGSKDAALVS